MNFLRLPELAAKRSQARIPDADLRTIPLFATVDEAIAHYQGLIDAGVQYFLATVNGQDTQTADLLARQVLPALKPAGGWPPGSPPPGGTHPGPSLPSSS